MAREKMTIWTISAPRVSVETKILEFTLCSQLKTLSKQSSTEEVQPVVSKKVRFENQNESDFSGRTCLIQPDEFSVQESKQEKIVPNSSSRAECCRLVS